MTKRLVVILCAVMLLAAPIVAMAAQVNTFFPAQSQFAMAATTGSPLHSVLGIDLATLELFFVALQSNGAPGLGPAWIYGTVVSVTLLTPNLVRVTWLVSASTGGRAPFIPAGTIVLDFII